MRNFLLTATVLSLVSAGYARAESSDSMSTQQLINALTPGANITTQSRGIEPLDSSGGMSAPGVAPAAEPQAPQHETPQGSPPTANLEVDFASGSAALTPQAVDALDTLGKALTSTQLASFNFKIVGHTDTVGDAGTNQTLSEQRAAAVKTYLEGKFGVAETRLRAQGVGETDLLVQTPAGTPDIRNRRVEIVNLGQ